MYLLLFFVSTVGCHGCLQTSDASGYAISLSRSSMSIFTFFCDVCVSREDKTLLGFFIFITGFYKAKIWLSICRYKDSNRQCGSKTETFDPQICLYRHLQVLTLLLKVCVIL